MSDVITGEHRAPARPRTLTLPRWLEGLPRNPTAWAMLGLTVVSLLQRPGRETFDTKLDLVVDPAWFLGRALHLWDPMSTSGQLQNQAYGYFFPVGPYFVLCQAIGLPPWIAQRLWCALLLCLAFLGALLLARALRIGSEPARFAAALGYALAPRMLTEIGPVSAEMLPTALLPWIMLPLVRAGKIGSPRRAAGFSALAVLCIGGINGAMVVMVLVLPALWLLTRRWTREHVKLVLWWCGSVLLAMLWWILPLLLLGQYSLPFLDYIETASNTTAPLSLFQVLRGTNQWVAYVVVGRPWWPAGFMLIDNQLLMLATGLVAGIGLAGLARARLPERRFLLLGVLTGLTLLTLGHVGTLAGPLAEPVRDLLDGPLAPLRNVHKFEPVLRLPLMLAFAHALTGPLPLMRRTTSAVVATRARVAIGFLLVLVMAAPAWQVTLRPGPGWDELPGYWRSAMSWLAEQDRDARTLLLPASGFAEYTWGRTVDEPAQPLARAPWAVRGQIPLGSEGNTRVMDAVEDALASGRGSAGLADFLARSGFRFLLLRNDIDRIATGSPPVSLLRAGLAASPGISRAAGFGPDIAPGIVPAVSTVDLPAPATPAVEIFEVRRPVPKVSVVSTQDSVTVSGGPESLLPLLNGGVLARDSPAVLAGDGGAPEGRGWLVTDGLRHKERNVGRARSNLSQTMTADEPTRQQRPAPDVLPFPGIQHQTVAAFRGIRAVTASTAASFADSVSGSEPSRQPFAAIDGDPLTAWNSSAFTGPRGQWLEVELDTPRMVSVVTLTPVYDLRVGWPVARVRISTDAGVVDRDVAASREPQTLTTAPGLTGRIRITVLSVLGDRSTGNTGIAELAIPGVTPHRALQVPRDPVTGPVAFAFTRGDQPHYACVSDVAGQRCSSALARVGEEPDGIDRLFSTPAQDTYRVEGTVLPAGRNPVSVAGFEVSGSSQLAGDPAAGPLAAVDGDPNTTWITDVGDPHPILTLAWPGARTLTGVRVSTAPTSGGIRPTELEIRAGTEFRSVPLDADGFGKFSLTTDRVELALRGVPGTIPADEVGPARDRIPAGISEIQLSGVDDLAARLGPNARFTVPCGAGPTIDVDGFAYGTTVSGTLADITRHRPLAFATCRDLQEGLELPAGEHEVRTARSDSFVVQDLRLVPLSWRAEAPAHREVSVRQWDVTRRAVEVGPGPAAVLSVPENANAGWVATVDGKELARVRVDGWQQAWLLPAGQGGVVRLDFVPDQGYRNRLLIGAVAALGLLALLAVPVRRPHEAARRWIPLARRRSPGTAVVPAEGRRWWIPFALIGILAVLGGPLPVVLLIGCLLLRTIWRRAPVFLAFGGMLVAVTAAVAGRVLEHGQEWANGFTAQAALLLAAAAVASACIDWFVRDSP